MKFLFVFLALFLTQISIQSTEQIVRAGGNQFHQSISETLMNLTHRGVHLWNKQNINASTYFVLKSVNNATSQIVSGSVYKLNVVLKETACQKADLNLDQELTTLLNGEFCLIHGGGNKLREINCSIKIWSKPWMNFVELVDPQEPDQPGECNLPSYSSVSKSQSEDVEVEH